MKIIKKLLSLFSKNGCKAVKTVSISRNNKHKEKIMENEEEKVEETVKTEETVKPEETVAKTEEVVENKETEQPRVEETSDTGNGIRLEDVALKDWVLEQMGAMGAKLDALIKENTDLKNKLAESNGKVEEMQKKYEEKDFGTYTKNGVTTKNEKVNETFDEYAKQFIGK